MTIDEQIEFLKKGTVDVIREEDLKSKLERSAKSGKPLRVKLGLDPTAPDIHVGHTVVIRKLKAFQNLGHSVILRGRTSPARRCRVKRLTPTQRLISGRCSSFSIRKRRNSDSTASGWTS